ncbi:hypothetical protein GCM10022225_71480 [Plantactinospora mayteni]|uniref:Uncharacterized protein n=1 Tax=Plantactinospora mayteni TaxID=566021 RepID=A0ABQ4F132_9ACTN|nr:hypothetical protein Pma05_71730 [Plantactinospora mayteni]
MARSTDADPGAGHAGAGNAWSVAVESAGSGVTRAGAPDTTGSFDSGAQVGPESASARLGTLASDTAITAAVE